jgi:outer membrane immunogenic protein
MRKYLLTTALTLLITAPAVAADMQVKAPKYQALPPVMSWAGFYIGGSVGYRWAHATATDTDTFAFADAGGPNTFLPTSINLNRRGDLGGAQIGYNYQFAPTWVAGIEVDFDYARIKADNGPGVPLFGNPATGFPAGPIIGTAVTAQASYRDSWSIRGRIGYAQPMYLVYATGGYAQMRVDFNGNVFLPVGAGGALTTLNSPGGVSANRSGWVAGGGIEFRPVPGPWIVGVEYLHYQFDGTNTALAAFVPPTTAGDCAAGQQCLRYSLGNVDVNAARLRVSYKFGD